MKPILILALMALAGAAQGGTEYWDYKDWHVMAETVDTGEDVRVLCTAWTGGDGAPSLRIDVSDGDAGPPDVYPAVELRENAVRGHDTVMQDGQRVLFRFDLDWWTEGQVVSGRDEAGFAWASARPQPGDSREMLRTMRKAQALWVTRDGAEVHRASLRGFAAAYGKIAQACGFSTRGVLD